MNTDRGQIPTFDKLQSTDDSPKLLHHYIFEAYKNYQNNQMFLNHQQSWV
tara:strand:+ start:679 stop:828 length:150 start_codon:yes stop_codon:yes gene_type:complete